MSSDLPIAARGFQLDDKVFLMDRLAGDLSFGDDSKTFGLSNGSDRMQDSMRGGRRHTVKRPSLIAALSPSNRISL